MTTLLAVLVTLLINLIGVYLFIIDNEGNIMSVYKQYSDIAKTIGYDKKTATNIGRAINRVDKSVYEYKIATREHHINMIKKDVLYYSKNVAATKKIKIDMYDEHTNRYITSFESMTKAVQELGYTKQAISNSIMQNTSLKIAGVYFKKTDIL